MDGPQIAPPGARAPAGDEDLLREHEWGSGVGPEFCGPRHEYRESLIIRRLEGVIHAGRVLNAGSGGGSLTLSLLDRGFDVTSADVSEQFLERIRVQLAGTRHAAATVVNADLTDLHFADDSFDAVVCGEVLEHIEDDVRALKEMRRVLKDGGVLVATVPANPWRYDWFDRWVGHIRRYTPEGLEERLKQVGFEDVTIQGWGFPITGLYYRLGYRPFLRRRLRARGAMPSGGASGSLVRRIGMRAFRAVLEVDSLFIGRNPGYFGLLVVARAGALS